MAAWAPVPDAPGWMRCACGLTASPGNTLWQVLAAHTCNFGSSRYEAPYTTLPGVKAKHAIITDTCRTNRGDQGAFVEAVDRLRVEYNACALGQPVGRGVAFHLVLVVDRRGRAP